MRDSIKNYSGGGVPVTDEALVHDAVPLAASATSADSFVDVDRFSQAIILVDMSQNFTAAFYLSNNTADSYELEQKTAQIAGKRAYVVNLKGAKYLNVKVTNAIASAATLSVRVLLASG